MRQSFATTEKVRKLLTRRSSVVGACLEWDGPPRPDGYGEVRIDYKLYLVHRVAYEVYTGATLTSIDNVCHTCDNRRCIRREHLFLGSKADNTHDMQAKGRHRNATGFTKPITMEIARQIRAMYRTGKYSQREIGRLLGYSIAAINHIVNNKTWIDN